MIYRTVITSWCLSLKINEQEWNEWFTETNKIDNADRYFSQKWFFFFFIISKLHQKIWKPFKEFISWIWLKLFHQIVQIEIKISDFTVYHRYFHPMSNTKVICTRSTSNDLLMSAIVKNSQSEPSFDDERSNKSEKQNKFPRIFWNLNFFERTSSFYTLTLCLYVREIWSCDTLACMSSQLVV